MINGHWVVDLSEKWEGVSRQAERRDTHISYSGHGLTAAAVAVEASLLETQSIGPESGNAYAFILLVGQLNIIDHCNDCRNDRLANL